MKTKLRWVPSDGVEHLTASTPYNAVGSIYKLYGDWWATVKDDMGPYGSRHAAKLAVRRALRETRRGRK